ncbi:MAG TPA: hypothetical protein VHV30_11755 [Polyangiaceae bacterium]|jgi:hypothetical protein|nr:hypothetical protein [Polyangiaceae bacterium]
MSTTSATPASTPCLTCYGTGEAATDGGAPERCPDCFGEGKALGRSTKLEWRLRSIERAYAGAESETRGDVTWLVSEVRHAREALLRILARCQEETDSSGAAKDAVYIANEALGLYEPMSEGAPRRA